MDDIKKEFVAWTTRVSVIENQLNQNSSVFQANTDEDCLSVHPPTSPLTFDEVDQLSQDNTNAIEAPLAEFFDPEDTSLRKWSPSKPFRAFLEKNLKRRLTVDQVNEIIGENSLPETDACVAPYLDKQILNYVPNGRRKGVENRDKDLLGLISLIQRAFLNSASPLCCLHDRLERKDHVSNEELLTILQQS